MIVFDTETTGLPKPEVLPLKDQPQIIEFAALRLHYKTLREEHRIEFRCNPGTPLPPEITKITGITDDQLKDKPTFAHYVPELTNFFLGEECMLSHFLVFDKSLLKFELQRLGLEFSFPWPPKQLCSAEASTNISGNRLSLSQLYLVVSGKKDMLAFKVGQYVKHKTMGLGTIKKVDGDNITMLFDGKTKDKVVKASALKGTAFEGAHGAMKDTEVLAECVRWLRKQGHL